MLGKLPPCPGRAKLGAFPAVNANKAIKDHLSFGQTVETEQTRSFLSSDKHQLILLASHFCSFQLGKSLPPRADKRSRTGVLPSARSLFFSPWGQGSTILQITEKMRERKGERDLGQTWLSKSSLNFGEIWSHLWIVRLSGMAFALGAWIKVKPSFQWTSLFSFLIFFFP